jgi:uncharacterized protein (UPF0332 family)
MNSEERELLDLASQNIQAAELLASQSYYGIAASRGYYAMFYIAEALLLRRGLHFSKHSAVIAAYGKEYSSTNDLDPKFHDYMIKAQAVRLLGDYDHTEIVTGDNANQILAWAGEFLAAAKKYLK